MSHLRNSAAALFTLALAVLCALAPALAPAQPHSTPTHSFGGAQRWSKIFDDPARDAWQKPHEVIQALGLKPDAVVADLGAGTGYFSVRLARMLPAGKVYAVDAEPDMVRHLANRARTEALKNMLALAATAQEVRLPEKVDVVLLVDVYHHIGERERYFRGLAGSLKPGGRIAVIDFRMNARQGPARAARVAPERVKEEMRRAGFEPAGEYDFLPEQFFLVFRPGSG